MHQTFLTLAATLLLASPAIADGPQDNIPEKVRRVPPPGKKLTDADRQELSSGAADLAKEIAELATMLKGKAALLELLPDVEIFSNAVQYPLEYDEFFKDYDKQGQNSEVTAARKMLKLGFERAKALREGKTPWTTATGLIVRGYRSRIDGSVQPYGLVVPPSYEAGRPYQHRLDIWFHGRGETLSELNFLNDRLQNPGQFTPAHAFVLHPYGRYCNANHFAGEVDTFEALEHVQKHYPIDENRIVVRGFSMGGAACWHFAVHHAWRWAAAAPGAGFSETPQFLKVFQSEKVEPTWYQKKLWHWYDCNDWALNLYNCPTVAYSGTKDSQKQAADVMAAAMEKIGLPLVHILGPDTGHSYHPVAKAEINRRIDSIVAKGRDPMPRKIEFTTWTLRYPRMHWITVEGLEKHWERASVTGSISSQNDHVYIFLKNVTALTLHMEPGWCPIIGEPRVTIHDIGDDRSFERLETSAVGSDRSWTAQFRKEGKVWRSISKLDTAALAKRPGLQGPIDDAFMDRFLMVRPTGKALNAKVEKWAADELAHAREHWRSQFRGIAPIKDDAQVTEADIAGSNLILWGDPGSNSILAKFAGKLPIVWSEKGVTAGGKTYDVGQHVPVLIYPNPLNPKKYVVINSGFTFREYDYLNNARQVPRLPDWAIVDISEPPTSQWPGRVVDAGFFDERWQMGEK